MSEQTDPADFDGVTPDIRRAAEKRAAALTAARGGDAVDGGYEPAEPTAKKSRGQTTR